MKHVGRRHFHGTSDAPGAARRWITEVAALRAPALLDDILVMVSELATNAVRHAGGSFEIGVLADATTLRVEVADSSPSVPQTQWVPAGATSGRGLLIVETLSDNWGVAAKEGGGKTVWFEVAIPAPSP